MEWEYILDSDVDPEEILLERLPEFHRDRLRQFRSFVDTPLIFCVKFEDTGQCFTAQLGPDDARTEDHELIDFPQATARGTTESWRRSLDFGRRLAEPADRQIERHEGHIQISESLKRGFEKFDGILEVEITDVPDGGSPLCFEIILNDYEAPPRAPRAELRVHWQVLVDLANGVLGPVEAAKKVTVRGAMGLAFDIGGFLMRELDL